MMERRQFIADGEGSYAEAVVEEEADASHKKGDGGWDGPGCASSNHDAEENASEKNSEGKTYIVQCIVHQPLGGGDDGTKNGTCT